MAPELLEIQPRQLTFTFEPKMQSSCSVRLVNNSDSYVAFKVKTTSPKRYSVRPNTGVILPRSTCDFTVTMQALRVAPPDMQLKDKFLIQSTLVPFGTTDEDIVPSFFSKDNDRYVEEHKLRVVLVSPPDSPDLQPINEAVKTEPTYDAPVLKEPPVSNEVLPTKVDNQHPSLIDKDTENLRKKLNNLEIQLKEAEKIIASVREEKNVSIQERDKLQQDVALLRRQSAAKVQVGFPGLVVVFMMLVGIVLGFWLNL